MEKLSAAFLLVAAAGIGLAVYVGYDYVTQDFSRCYITSTINCASVYLSGHTSLFGIPFYVAGLVWFPLIFLVGLITSKAGRSAFNSEILLPLLMLGNVFTIYLWYLELVVIHAVCPLCLSLYIVNYALTGLTVIGFVGAGSSPEGNAFLGSV